MKVIYTLSLFLILIIVTINSISIVNADAGYCHDQDGDGHPCIENKNKCQSTKKIDEKVESLYY